MNQENELEEIKTDTVTVFNIDESTEKAKDYYKQLVRNTLLAFKNAIGLGYELTLLKDHLPHGQFTKHLKENLNFISERTARRYMQIYDKREFLKEKLGEKLELKKAYKLLSEKKPKTDTVTVLIDEPKTIELVKDILRPKKIINKVRKHKELEPSEKEKVPDVINKLEKDSEKLSLRIQRRNETIKKQRELDIKDMQKLEEIKMDIDLLKRTP
jgi:hypothetical protein